VFATLAHLREDTAPLDRAIEDAFPGARLIVPEPGRIASFGMVFPDYPHRVFDAAELSDGTLRYLALAGALLAYRLPAFIALNEPETSLHPDLLEPLARLVAAASRRTQIWLVTHSEPLAAALARFGGVAPHTVVKRDGATWLDGLTLSGAFREAGGPAVARAASANQTFRLFGHGCRTPLPPGFRHEPLRLQSQAEEQGAAGREIARSTQEAASSAAADALAGQAAALRGEVDSFLANIRAA